MHGDGWMPYMYTPEMLASSLAEIRAGAVRPVRGGLFIWGCVHRDGATALGMAGAALSRIYAQDFTKLVGRYAFAGTPADVVGQLQAFGDAGAETILVSFACPNEYIEESQRLFADEVLPALRASR